MNDKSTIEERIRAMNYSNDSAYYYGRLIAKAGDSTERYKALEMVNNGIYDYESVLKKPNRYRLLELVTALSFTQAALSIPRDEALELFKQNNLDVELTIGFMSANQRKVLTDIIRKALND